MSKCTDCLIDLTDACPRGAGRAIDDEVCESFIPRETYQVNKNESWQLGYQQGRADAIEGKGYRVCHIHRTYIGREQIHKVITMPVHHSNY